MASYCAQADLYQYGLPRGSVPNPGRLVNSASAGTNALSLDVHGFALNDVVSFRAESGGALPAPLVAGTEYYAIPLTEATFAVAATSGGAAIDLTNAGSRIVVVAPLPFASAIAWASSMIENMLPAHVVPLEAPYPDIIVMTCAELAAGRLLALKGVASKSLSDIVDAANARLARWAKGIPLRGSSVPTAANLAVGISAGLRDSRGWRTYGGW